MTKTTDQLAEGAHVVHFGREKVVKSVTPALRRGFRNVHFTDGTELKCPADKTWALPKAVRA